MIEFGSDDDDDDDEFADEIFIASKSLFSE